MVTAEGELLFSGHGVVRVEVGLTRESERIIKVVKETWDIEEK